MVKQHSEERAPFSLFHAAVEREKEEAAKQEHHIEMIKRGQVSIFELKEGANEMVEQAITKLKAEMNANKSNGYVQGVGQYLIEYVQANPDAATHVIDAQKTIKGSYTEMERLAKAKKGSGAVMFMPQEGFEIIMKYFGIKGAVMTMSGMPTSAPVANDTTTPVQAKEPTQVKTPSLNVSLADLL